MAQRPLPLSADPASSLPCPDHQRGVGPAHRQQGGVILSPADVGHLSAVTHVALETGVLTLCGGAGGEDGSHIFILMCSSDLSHNSLRMILWVCFMFLMFSHPAFHIFYHHLVSPVYHFSHVTNLLFLEDFYFSFFNHVPHFSINSLYQLSSVSHIVSVSSSSHIISY